MKKVSLLLLLSAAGLMAQAPTITEVLNGLEVSAGIKDTRLSPGQVATIFGSGFGNTTTGVTVTVGQSSQALVLTKGVAPTQMNVQLGFDAPVGDTSIVVTVNGVPSSPFNVTLLATAPTVGFTAPNMPDIFDVKFAQVTAANPVAPGATVIMYASGLGPTNPPTTVQTNVTMPLPLADTPTMTIGGVQAAIRSASYTSASGYQLNFVVPMTVQGSQPLVLSVGGQSSPPVTLAIVGITALVNGASFLQTGTGAAEEIVTIYATGLTSAATTQNVSVTFNTIAAPLFAVLPASDQINLIVPSQMPTSGTVQVQLTTSTFTGINLPLLMDAAVPGIFLVPDPSNPQAQIAAAQFANTTWLALPNSTAQALGWAQNCTASDAPPVSNCGQPAAPGDYIVLYVTGLGLATAGGDPTGDALGTGVTAPASGSPLYKTVATPTVKLGGIAAKPLFSGIAPGFEGLYQIDFQVPQGVPNGDSVPLTVSMPGSTTGSATMAIQSR